MSEAKTSQLQVRVSPAEKREIERRAKAAGMSISAWLLARLLNSDALKFAELLEELSAKGDQPCSYGLAALNDFLTSLHPRVYRDAVALGPEGLSPFHETYVAAMVEQAAVAKGVAPPPWTRGVGPLKVPYFATSLKSVRLHLLISSPIPFQRRNLFVDASVGARV